MKYTYLWRTPDHSSTYEIAKENRILDCYRAESTFEELFDSMVNTVDYLDNKYLGDFIIPASFITEDYIPAQYKDQDTGESKTRRDSDGNNYVGRLADNVEANTMMPIDIDGGMSVEEAKDIWKDYNYILYSSFNHMVDGVTPKFRLLVEYAEPIARDDYKIRRKSLLKAMGGEAVDETTTYLSRGFFMPGFNKEFAKHSMLEFNAGKKFDIMALDVEEIVPYVGEPTEMSDDDRRDILEKLKETTIGTYPSWWQMLQGLKSEGYSIQDALYVTADNAMHASSGTGIKDATLTKNIWSGLVTQNGGIGKLITIIRGSFPEYRKSKMGMMQEELANTTKTLEERIAELSRKGTKV